MNGSDVMSKLFKNHGKPAVFFDDQDLGSILYRSEQRSGSPTPAEVLSYWLQGRDLMPGMERALASVIPGKIKLVLDLGKGKEASDLLKKSVDSTDNGMIKKIRSLIGLWDINLVLNPDSSQANFDAIKELVEQCKDRLDEETKKRWDRVYKQKNVIERKSLSGQALSDKARTGFPDFGLMFDLKGENGFRLRSQAFDKFAEGDFSGAEIIYRKMIEMNFELPGTLCHLARVQLLMHQEKEAFDTVDRAWKSETRALHYVIPRILFLKIFLSILDGVSFKAWTDRLNTYFNGDSDLMQWDIRIVIEAYRERLQREHYNFLFVLADVISGNEKSAALEQFEFWPKQKGRLTSDADASF